VQGTLTLKRIHTLAVPRLAILTGTPAAVQENQTHDGVGRASQAYLFRVVNGKAQRVNVQTGITARGLVAVKDGIRPGDRIVVLGNYELTDGARVTELKP
jgi:hypothetical protein